MASLLQWSDALSVNVAEIDAQHHKLVDMINELNDAMKVGKGKDVIGAIVTRLANYTVAHFGLEERYFDRFGYPDAEAHKLEHKKFIEEVTNFQKEFESGRIGLTLRVMTFLSDWLRKHIQGTDKKYSAFFNANGLK